VLIVDAATRDVLFCFVTLVILLPSVKFNLVLDEDAHTFQTNYVLAAEKKIIVCLFASGLAVITNSLFLLSKGGLTTFGIVWQILSFPAYRANADFRTNIANSFLFVAAVVIDS
jgi:hypothetical protein